MLVIGSATIGTLFVNSDKFFENIATQRSVIIRIENPMLIEDILTDLGEGIPFVFERMLSIF